MRTEISEFVLGVGDDKIEGDTRIARPLVVSISFYVSNGVSPSPTFADVERRPFTKDLTVLG